MAFWMTIDGRVTLAPTEMLPFKKCDENHREVGAQGTVGKISDGIKCRRQLLLTSVKVFGIKVTFLLTVVCIPAAMRAVL